MLLVFRANQTVLSDQAGREVWLAAGQPGEGHPRGFLLPTWDEALPFARQWAELYQKLSVSIPGHMEWSYYPPTARGRLEVKDWTPEPIQVIDELSRGTDPFRQVRFAWGMQGFYREIGDGWTPPPPWVRYPRFTTAIHVIPLQHESSAWADPEAWYR